MQTDYRKKKKDRDAKRTANPDVEQAAKELADLTGESAIKIEDQMYSGLEAEQDPANKSALNKQYRELAEQHHGGHDEYEDFLRSKAEQQALDAQNRQQPKRKRNQQPVKPFSPDDLESFTLEYTP